MFIAVFHNPTIGPYLGRVQSNPHTLSLCVCQMNFSFDVFRPKCCIYFSFPPCVVNVPFCPSSLFVFEAYTVVSFQWEFNCSAVWLLPIFCIHCLLFSALFHVPIFYQISGLKWKTLRHIAMTNWLSFYNMDNAEFIFFPQPTKTSIHLTNTIDSSIGLHRPRG